MSSEIDKLYNAAHKDYEDRKEEAINKLYEVIEFLKEREI